MQGRLPSRKEKKARKLKLRKQHQPVQTHKKPQVTPMSPQPMNRQVDAPVLLHGSIFTVFANYLDASSLCALASTSQRANDRINQVVMNNPESVLRMLGKCSRRQAAQFFQMHRIKLGTKVVNWLEENPDNHAAYTLYLMMCCVRTSMVDLSRLDKAQQYLHEHHFPQRIQLSIHFIGSFLKAKTASHAQRSDIMKKCLKNEIDFYINLRGANLTQLSLNVTDFTGADLRSTDMSEGSFMQCIFSYADMFGTEVTRAEMQLSTFYGANLRALIDENDMGNFHQSSLFCGQFFRKWNLRYEQGKTIYPTEQVMLQNIADIKHDLARLNKGAPYVEFVLYAMTNDFLNAVRCLPGKHQEALIEFGKTCPLFATHYDSMPAFINENIMHLHTSSQAEIEEYRYNQFDRKGMSNM